MQDKQRVARAGMGTFVRWIGLCSLSTSAIAAPHDPGMTFGVVSVPETVTVSTSQQTPVTNVAYLITFNNRGGSAVTSTLVFGELTSTTGLTGAAILGGTVNPALPSQCAVTATTFNCNFGTVGAGAVIDFPLIVAAPQYAAGGSTDNQKLTLSVTSTHREGNSITGNSITTLTDTVDTPVAPQSTTSMKSVVLLKTGGQFFTGGNGIPKVTDVYTSAVSFQPLDGVAYSLVTIDEIPFPATDAKCIGGKHFKTCFTTKLYAPAVTYVSGHLTETIRVHPENFRPGAANKMGTVIWEYTATDALGNPTGSPTVVGQCPSVNPPTPRSDGIPCQVSFKCYTSDKVLGWTPELDQTCEFVFINKGNGFQRGY